MTCSEEEWKPIPGYYGMYEASTLGRIKRVGHPRRIQSTFIMKPQRRGEHGYLGIGLCDPVTGKQRYFFVHLVILATFVGPKPPGAQGNHKNFDKKDNALGNLEYITPQGNTHHALRNGVRKKAGRGRCLSPAEVREIQALLETEEGRLMTNAAIGARYGTSYETIRSIRHGKRWLCLAG